MKSRMGFMLMAGLLLASVDAAGQGLASRRAQHLRHGINTSEWFAQARDYSLERLRTYTTLDDLRLMRQLGFDHVRLSVDPAIFDCPGDWNACEPVQYLDGVVSAALAGDLAVIVDLHPTSEFKRELAGGNEAVEKFVLFWSRVAEHFAGRDPERLFFEVLNEPEISDPYRWAGIQARVAAEIHRVAPQQTVIVSGARWSNIEDLLLLPEFREPNVIYNFHYYEPHIFTHQGAGWGTAFWRRLRQVPYPANDEELRKSAEAQPEAYVRWRLSEYALDRWDAERIGREIAFVAQWARERGVPLTCNEFGVYRNYSDPGSRMRWLADVRRALEQNHIGWTMWDYRGGFGVVRKQGAAAVPDDDVLRALGLKH